VAALPADSSAPAEALSEMLVLVMGEDEIVGWQPVGLERARSSIIHPLGNAAEHQQQKKAGNLFLDVRVRDGLSH